MAAKGRVGRVAAEVVADVTRFAAQLAKDLNNELRKVKLNMGPVSDQIGDGVQKGVDEAGKALDDLPRKAKKPLAEVGDQAKKAGEELADQVKEGSEEAKESLAGVGDAGKKAGDELADGLGKGSRKAAAEAKAALEQIEREMETVDLQIDKVKRDIQDLSREFARTGDQEIHLKLADERRTLLQLHRIRAALDEVGDEARQTERRMRSLSVATLIGTLSTALRSTTALAGKFGEGILGVGSALISLGSVVQAVITGLVVVAIASLVPVIIAVGAALFDLLALAATMPAALGLVLAVVAPLVVAFHGFADAIKAVIDGDPEKITEALKGLSPAARSVVKEFAKLLPSFKGLGKAVQESFFKPLVGELSRVTKALLPPFRKGLTLVAGALGRIVYHLAEMARSPRAIEFLNKVFATAARILDRSSTTLTQFFNAFLRLGIRALPLVERFANWLLRVGESFAIWLRDADRAGKIQDWLDQAVQTLKDLGGLAKAVGRVLKALFGDADDDGRTFLEHLTEIVNKWADWLESPEGQEFIQNILDSLPGIISGLGQLISLAIGFGKGVNEAVDKFNELKQFFTEDLPGAIGDARDAVGGFFSDIGDAISGFFENVGEVGSQIGQFFADLPGRVGGALASLPGIVWSAFQTAVDMALMAIGIGLGIALYTFLNFPSQVWGALQALPGLLSQLFNTALNAVVSIWFTGFHNLVAFATTIPDRVRGALSRVRGILSSLWSSAISNARSIVVAGFNRIVDEIFGVPGRMARAATRFRSAGVSLAKGFMNGLKAVGGFATDVGNAIFRTLKSQLNRAIGSINSGISKVDRVFPGDLPRIPYLATGGMTLGPVLAALSETGKREVVLPIEDSRTMAALRAALGTGGDNGPQILFGENSINVTFAGVVPTQAEAFQTGLAVGEGVATALARRNLRTTTRTL